MLEDMPEYVLFEQAHTEEGNPFWQITLKPRKKEKKNAAKKYPDDIRAFAYLPGSTLEIFHEKIHHLMKKDDTPLQMLSDAYRSAVKGRRITEKDDTCLFPTGYDNKDGEPISVFFARNTRKNPTRRISPHCPRSILIPATRWRILPSWAAGPTYCAFWPT